MEFPAGRIEKTHSDLRETARHELEEETGIRASKFEDIGVIDGFVTKGSERIYCFLARECEFNSTQSLDPTEDIEVVLFTPQEFEDRIKRDHVLGGQTIAVWYMTKLKFPELFS